jgi:predicted RNA-binding protein with PIN domain
MPLQFIIDGYNIIHHPAITKKLHKDSSRSIRASLVRFIITSRLCGSSKNTVVIVFDGYPDARAQDNFSPQEASCVRFSFDETADKKIKYLLARAANPKETIVVSDDREIIFYAKEAGAKPWPVADFVRSKDASCRVKQQSDNISPELSHSQMARIDEEMRRIWLK